MNWIIYGISVLQLCISIENGLQRCRKNPFPLIFSTSHLPRLIFSRTPPHQKTRPLQKVWIAPANKLTKHWICLGGFGGQKWQKISGGTSAVFFYKVWFLFPLSIFLASDQVLKSFISTKPSTKCDVPKCRGWGRWDWFQVLRSTRGKSRNITPFWQGTSRLLDAKWVGGHTKLQWCWLLMLYIKNDLNPLILCTKMHEPHSPSIVIWIDETKVLLIYLGYSHFRSKSCKFSPFMIWATSQVAGGPHNTDPPQWGLIKGSWWLGVP